MRIAACAVLVLLVGVDSRPLTASAQTAAGVSAPTDFEFALDWYQCFSLHRYQSEVGQYTRYQLTSEVDGPPMARPRTATLNVTTQDRQHLFAVMTEAGLFDLPEYSVWPQHSIPALRVQLAVRVNGTVRQFNQSAVAAVLPGGLTPEQAERVEHVAQEIFRMYSQMYQIPPRPHMCE